MCLVLCTTCLRFSREKRRLATREESRVQCNNVCATKRIKKNRSWPRHSPLRCFSAYTGISPICQHINHRIDWPITSMLITSNWRLSVSRIRDGKADCEPELDFHILPTYFNLFNQTFKLINSLTPQTQHFTYQLIKSYCPVILIEILFETSDKNIFLFT